MKQIILSKRDILTKADKAALRKEGYIVLEVSSMADILVINQGDFISSDMVLRAAIEALSYESGAMNARLQFGKLIREAVTDKLTKK